MSNHTPGPWSIKRKGHLIIKSIGPCEPDEYAGAAWLELSEADASLIASAPDLLEALRSARETILDLCKSRGSEAEGTEQDWVGDIDAVISKAEGRS